TGPGHDRARVRNVPPGPNDTRRNQAPPRPNHRGERPGDDLTRAAGRAPGVALCRVPPDASLAVAVVRNLYARPDDQLGWPGVTRPVDARDRRPLYERGTRACA